MMRPSSNQETIFGYLSVVHSKQHGYFGGYLLISVLGRPLEFHCSAPIRPSRAQEILYGPTLQPYLLGEQIGGTLLGKAKLSPRLVLTDQPAALCLRGEMNVPLLCLLLPDAAGARLAHARSDTCHHLAFNGHDFELPAGYAADRDVTIALLAQLAAHVELAEPFDRIQEAIREAQRISAGGQDSHGHAA